MNLFDAIDATWPPARLEQSGPFTLRISDGGGKRVSAASTGQSASEDDIRAAEGAMRAAGQTPLFMLRGDQPDLDAQLHGLGYPIVDPVVVLQGPIDTVAGDGPQPVSAFPIWPPLAVMAEVWQAAGVGPARQAVMARAADPKTAILGRSRDHPAGCAFVSLHGSTAMLHALEVLPEARRHGCATNMVRGAAVWARDRGADSFTALTTQANAEAQALFASLGLLPVEHYHYRIHPTAGDPA